MHGTKPGVGLIVSAAVAVCAACGAVNERPYLTPLPNANVDSVHALPSAVITEIEALLVAQGMEVRNTHDPSLPERENERMVSEDHPGHELLSQLLAALEEHFGTGHS